MKILKLARAGLAALLFVFLPPAAHAATITVFAAASLTNALNAIGRAYEATTGDTVSFSFAASSTLAKQIAASRGADIFLSADEAWMDYLDQRGLIAPGTRRNLLGNHLVLIEPASRNASIAIAPNFDLKAALGGGRLAIADPGSVPAGKYAKAALTNLGVWDEVSGKLAPAENVRVALAYVARGEAPLGIVYTTDAISEPAVRIAGTFPDDSHLPILYPVALTKGAVAKARRFLTFLTGADARGIFLKDGFIVLHP